ncbi:MAG: YdbH domain-containing protein [Alphaproteobacteria bacterium]
MKKYFVLLAFLLVLAGVAIFLPYRAWLEKRLELILEAKGFQNIALTISSAGLNSASIENVSIGGENKLNVKNIVLAYSPRELWNGYLRDLSIAGVTLDVRQDHGRWVITGLEGLSTKPESNVSEPLAVPVTPEQLKRIPFERIKLEDSVVNIMFGNGKLSLPLDLTWQKTPQSHLTYEGDDLAFKFNALDVTAGNLTLDAYINEDNNVWVGSWALKNIIFKGTSVPVPALKGGGDVSVDQSHATIKGKLTNDDKLWAAQFDINYDFAASDKSVMTIIHAGMPWKEGRIDVRDVKVPLEGESPVKVILQVQSVSIQELMQSLTGDRVSATGKVSGKLPLLVGRDGQITVLPGSLKSEGAGTISMPPDAIPGNNEQVTLVRQILEDLRYTGLTIAVKNDETGHLGVLMTFEGNNPAVYNGRPVKLNVNLTGDVLEFLQQNILLLTNPEQFLQQGNDEKN